MSKTVVAIYDDITVARQIVEDLVHADFERSDISLITNDAQNQYSHYLDEHYTPRDDAVTATEGAGFGAVVGALTGILVGLAALTIPGIGLAIVAGPIVAGITGMLTGAVTGGVVGALVKSGVPEDQAPYYAEGIRRGATLISLETADTLRAEDIMHRYGSIDIHERSSVWRQEGWKGFNATEETQETESTDKSDLEMRTTVSIDTKTTRFTHTTQGDIPAEVTPAKPTVTEERRLSEDEDTAKVVPVLATFPTDDGATPVVPIPEVAATAPVVQRIPESDMNDKGSSAAFQNMETTTDYPKG